MKRKIRFRAKMKGTDVWVEGDLVNECIESVNAKGERTVHEIDPDTLGEYAGMSDMLLRDVYEGDIVVLDGEPDMGSRLVVFYEQAFCLANRDEYEHQKRGSHPYMNDYAHMMHLDQWSNLGLVLVKGNIHDNPDMLE